MRPFQNRGDRVPSIGELRRVKGTRGTASGRASEVEGGRDVGPDGCSGLPRIVQIEGDLLEPPQTAHEDIDLALHGPAAESRRIRPIGIQTHSEARPRGSRR